MSATADCELLGIQVGIATATDEVEDTEVDVSVEPECIWGKVCYNRRSVRCMCDFYALSCEGMQLLYIPVETLADELWSVSVACVIVDVVVSGAAGMDVASSVLDGGTDRVGVVLGAIVVRGTG